MADSTPSKKRLRAASDQPAATPAAAPSKRPKKKLSMRVNAAYAELESRPAKPTHTVFNDDGEVEDDMPKRPAKSVVADDGDADGDANEDAGDLPPRKRSKKKKKGKGNKAAAVTKRRDPDDERDAVVAYLHEWKANRTAWRFSKNKQVWLLKHLYTRNKIPDSAFAIAVEYLEDLRGVARTRAFDEAKRIVENDGRDLQQLPAGETAADGASDDEEDEGTKEEEAEDDEEVAAWRLARAAELMRMLG
ncbi:hypothetical protein AMAG_15880 [Allomyces macrogynus ATCC 38327]|uniref:WKF domain-containing protein n=1 Tax=Allomyces macrogynus (strain ATCC 38327) TaxID=578462 RepID=A0A0L0T930_ALLM3|nr:hypothetical protein AMAG_15880 [Allomyces macrogynus ATCC 38327]|eukprot:KNE71225.1 hypothetical protein AMAG_15880 [Allomyces macrogynus ATCC 38327]